MIRGAGAGAAMGASGEVNAVFLWGWAIDEGAYDTAVGDGWQSPLDLRPACEFKGLSGTAPCPTVPPGLLGPSGHPLGTFRLEQSPALSIMAPLRGRDPLAANFHQRSHRLEA